MKNYTKAILILSSSVLFFSSCQKEASKPEEQTTTPVVSTTKFTWTAGSVNATADNSFYVPAFNNIYAAKVNGSYVDITLEDLNKGNHTINPSQGVTLEYSDGTNTLKGMSGTVTISENTGTALSGSYNCKLGNGTNISGSFTNIPQK